MAHKKKRIPRTHSEVEGQPPTHFVKIHEYIEAYREKNDISPSLPEFVKKGFGGSYSMVKKYLVYMAEIKMVKIIPGKYRGVIPLPREKWGTWTNPATGGRAHARQTQ